MRLRIAGRSPGREATFHRLRYDSATAYAPTHMHEPPSLSAVSPRRPKTSPLIAGLICGGIGLFLLAGFLAIYFFSTSGATKGFDNMFGDQHLKTAVALIELHKVRYGRYPGSFRDLKFIGQWDQLALQSTAYYPNADRTRYYLEVKRGWIGKPDLQMPEEFWQGTGYDPSLAKNP